ncbi:hypothetical protein [Sessilibacter sp. MAH2]
MTAEAEEKKGLIQTLLEAMGVPEGVLEHGLVGVLPLVLIVMIFLLLKEYYKESKEIFLKGRYLELDERAPLNEINNDDQFQHELNLKYTDYVEQFQDGTFRELYHQSLSRFLKLITYLTKEKIHFSAAIQNPNPFIGIFSRSAFTSKSFELCLKLALVYPLLFLMISWLFGGSGQLAGKNILDQQVQLIDRWLILVIIFFCGIIFYKNNINHGVKSKIYIFGALFLLEAIFYFTMTDVSSSFVTNISISAFIVLFLLISAYVIKYPLQGIFNVLAFVAPILYVGVFAGEIVGPIFFVGAISIVIFL